MPLNPPSTTRIRLDVAGQTLQAPTGQTLLRTLQEAGMTWPASCRNGTCRACIGRLARGSVRYEIEWPGLLPEEKAAGCVLPCAAYPVSDVVLMGPGC